MSSKSSCPKECGPRGDVIPTLITDEEPADLTRKPRYSCFTSADSSRDKPEEEVENTTSGKSEKKADDTSWDKPKEEGGNTAYVKPEEEEVEDTKASVQAGNDGIQKLQEIEHSSLFNIADAKSGDVDAPEDPSSNIEKPVQGAEIRSQKSPRSKSPNKPPRELLRASMLPPTTSQQVYNDHTS